MDWDKLRVFHAAADAGSFTHAGEALGLSQSAVSRQVSALEQELKAPLFHRHARGLILTEQGELLYRTAHEVFMQLEAVRTRLTDSRDKPRGDLRVTTTLALGTTWLTPRLREFIELYPDIHLQMILDDTELDLSMRQADLAIRLRHPVQPDLIMRKLFTVHFHVYASPEYLKRFGTPRSVADLDRHRIVSFGDPAPAYFRDINWLETAGRPAGDPRPAILRVNTTHGIRRAVDAGIGIGVLPDYLIDANSSLVLLLPDEEIPSFDTYLVYPEELKDTARIKVFRDFLLAKARGWKF
ncbi:LysR family transcriptional regulator [Tepidamorphus gemmatus]|jgi:DNA-binding transcriptional LysR family regulator|uniref:LysR family transcriptional regulator n=1 Tax=Tepidamorphus gemmatus TaxID=747076 RepID=A0A4R3MNQ2_9HYPH|nr:LysR family transcriptional regulator [Tepidamorphus gemmatus]TCT13686.1 LysR family transcriptional regulator [Tepidamorphus gemmatus]